MAFSTDADLMEMVPDILNLGIDSLVVNTQKPKQTLSERFVLTGGKSVAIAVS